MVPGARSGTGRRRVIPIGNRHFKTMNRIAEENPARRIQSFDTVLPDKVRARFTNPKRPPNPIGQAPRDGSTLWLAGAIVFAAIILGLAIGSARRQEAQQIAAQASTAPGASLEQPASAATPTQIAAAPLTRRPNPTGPRPELAVPRAELVRLPPPRAQLIRLPEWRVGGERPVMTPYGLEVSARLKGKLPSADMLPASGNAIGDAWVIGDTAWVWIAAPWTAGAKWIDP
jgi:hypothetical protein